MVVKEAGVSQSPLKVMGNLGH